MYMHENAHTQYTYALNYAIKFERKKIILNDLHLTNKVKKTVNFCCRNSTYKQRV